MAKQNEVLEAGVRQGQGDVVDVKLQWLVSPEIETLVDAIVKCKQELVTVAFAKLGMRTRTISCDVYVGSKLIEFLQMSDMWTPAVEETTDDDVVSYRRQKKTTELVADFKLFKLHRMDVLHADDIRIITIFQSDDHSADQMFFGNVEIVG